MADPEKPEKAESPWKDIPSPGENIKGMASCARKIRVPGGWFVWTHTVCTLTDSSSEALSFLKDEEGTWFPGES